MGKATGFLEYERKDGAVVEPSVRMTNFDEFHKSLPLEEQRKQGAWHVVCRFVRPDV